ncbi:hypothetical protein [Aquabacterium sp.]|uniref:hypothetical protein n=1 Tax=Aquabacterium sp. TaxID=1872578 RepID=UPI003D6D6F0D
MNQPTDSSPQKLPGSNYGFPNHEDGIQSGNLTDSKEDEHVTKQAPLKGEASGDQKAKRGANEEDVDTAQSNVSEGYGSSAKASIMSGRPDTGQAK